MNKRHLTLQVYIGVSFGILILISMLALAAVLSEIAKREVFRLATANIENLSAQMARELSAGMDGFARDVQLQATREVFRDPNAAVGPMRAALDEFVRNRPEYSYVSIADIASAKVIAGSGGIFEGGSGTGRPVFEQGKKGLFIGDVHDAVSLANLLPKPENGEPLRFLDAAIPVNDASGNPFRVLSAHISWQWTNSIRDSVLGPLKERRDVALLLVNTAGKVVLAPDKRIPVGSTLSALVDRMPGSEATVSRWSDGQDYLTTVAPTMPKGAFPGFGWQVVVRQPTATALASVATLRHGFFAGALCIALVSAVIAWLVAGRILLPVRRLAASAGRFTSRSAMEDDVPSRIGEVAQMQSVLLRLVQEGNTHLQTAQASEGQFRALAESLPHVVWQSGPDGVIEYRNALWDKELGSAPRARLEDLAVNLDAADDAQFVAAWRESRATGKDLACRVRLLNTDTGVYRWYSVCASAILDKDAQPLRWVGTFTNVSESVAEAEQAETALARERDAREEAERVAVMKDEFLATLSHELRTPLNAISGWGEIIARRAQQDELLAKGAAVINRNVKLQATLINDLLDTSAIIAGKISLERRNLDLRSLALSVVAAQEMFAQQKGVRVSLLADEAIFVHADERRITQIMTNLLSNAIKFSDPGQEVAVALRTDHNNVQLTFTDGGCGIEPAFLPHVFERFQQQDASSTRRKGGLGLGLAIADSLARLHGGVISAESKGRGQGAIFTVTLPVVVSAAPEDKAGPSMGSLEQISASCLAGMHILVTDDEEDARITAHAVLSSVGAKVSLAASAKETLALLDRERFDLLVCDMGMPEVDGHELIRIIRKGAHGTQASAIPAIALTAFAMKQDEMASLTAGFDAHVAKPISMPVLIGAINTVLQKQAQLAQ